MEEYARLLQGGGSLPAHTTSYMLIIRQVFFGLDSYENQKVNNDHGKVELCSRLYHILRVFARCAAQSARQAN